MFWFLKDNALIIFRSVFFDVSDEFVGVLLIFIELRSLMLEYNLSRVCDNKHGNTSDQQEDTADYALKFRVLMPSISIK
jgi:hypothetical protein